MVWPLPLYSDIGVALFDLLSSLSAGGLQPYSSLLRILCSASSWNLSSTASRVNSPWTLLSLVRTFTVLLVTSFCPTTE